MRDTSIRRDVAHPRFRRRRRASASILGSAILSLVTGSGCATHPHIKIDVPEAEAPPDVRLKAYEGLQPEGIHRTQVTTYRVDRFGFIISEGFKHAPTTDYLRLHNGMTVSDPHDLLPAVEADSQTERGVQAYESDRNFGWVLLAAAAGLGGLGVAAIDWGGNRFTECAGPCPAGFAVIGGVGLVVGAVGMLVAAVGWAITPHNLGKEMAFNAFDQDLRTRLKLCAEKTSSGLLVIPCEQLSAAKTRPSAISE